MTIPTIFETCRPRADVLRGAITEADFAADLSQVIVDKGNEECRIVTRSSRKTAWHWQGNGLQNRKGAALKSKPRPFGPLE